MCVMECKVSGLAEFGLEKSCYECNVHNHTYHFAKKQITYCISYHVLHIIFSYSMIPWDHGLDIRTSQNEDSTYGTSTREPSLANTESTSFIHTYFIFHSFIH